MSGKKIAITGPTGYVATNLARYLTASGYEVDLLSVRGDEWRKKDFCGYETIIHTAALLHEQGKKCSWKEFEQVNITLTFNLAEKAKNDGVKYFVFFSTMHVYGLETLEGPLSKLHVITKNTECIPKTLYAKSKYQAEQELAALAGEAFKVAYIRCPMIYGKYCPGNYRTLRKIVLLLHIIPDWKNQRSLLHIDNLCEFIKLCMEYKIVGVQHPQDKEYVCTADMMQKIVETNNSFFYHSKTAAFCIPFLATVIHPVKKAFGSLVVEKDLSDIGHNYHLHNFNECIISTED